MKHLFQLNGKLNSQESRILIPPCVCRNVKPLESQLAVALPDGNLNAWPISRPNSRNDFSDKEIGRVARKMAGIGEEVDRVVRAMSGLPKSENRVPGQSPSETVCQDPSEAGKDHTEVLSKIVPIADDEFGIIRTVFDEVAELLAYQGQEEAGLLFAPEGTQLATHFVQDLLGKKTASSFSLDTPSLNEAIRSAKEWGLYLFAVVHGHPDGVWQPSMGDVRYVCDLFAHPKNGSVDQFFMPLVVNGQFIPYILYRDDAGRFDRAQLKIIG